MWFAGNHCDVGGSYPETESRLSDIALDWMVEEALSLPWPIHVDRSVLRLYPDAGGSQHDERMALLSGCPRWVQRWIMPLIGEHNFGWREGHRTIPAEAPLHPSVLDRFRRPGVLVYGKIAPYRPRTLRGHRDVEGYWARPAAAAERRTERGPKRASR
jgi:hypothetical protein